jgi:hypothetical protein
MKKVTLLVLVVALFTTLTSQAENGEKQPLVFSHTEFVSGLAEATQSVQEERTIYLWEINTIYGIAKGYSPSMEHAEKMIGLAATKDLSNYTIIESATFKK